MGIFTRTYTMIMGEFFHHQKVYASGMDHHGRQGNREHKETRIPNTNMVQVLICKHICECCKNRKRVTASQILDFYINQNNLEITMDGKKVYKKSIQKGIP